MPKATTLQQTRPVPINRILGADLKYTAYNRVRALRLEDGSLEEKRFGNATALRDRTDADRYYNRVVGFSQAEIPYLDELIAFHHQIGRASTIALTPDRGSPTVLGALQSQGYGLIETNCLFTIPCSSMPHSVDPPPATPRGTSPYQMEIRRATPDDMAVVVALWSQGHEKPVPPEVIERRAAAQWVPEFPIYLALIDGQVAAMATLYLADGIAWLGNAGTFQLFQRQGCQLALLNHRIREAARLGCDLAVSDTQYGTSSHRNMLRAGMSLAYIEMVLTKPIE